VRPRHDRSGCPPLAHLGRIAPGEHRIETPVGTVGAILHDTGEVTVSNVESYRFAAIFFSTCRAMASTRRCSMGGNWFFLVDMQNVHMQENSRHHPTLDLEFKDVEELNCFYLAIRQACGKMGSQAPIARRSTTLSCLVHLMCAESTARISCSVPAKHTIDRLAAPGPAPSWHAFTLMEKFARAKPGGRKALSEVCLRAVSRHEMGRCLPVSKGPPL